MDQERRRMPRVPFVASAELLEVDSGTRMNAQVSELSLHGCYVDTLNPLPKGTGVYVENFHRRIFFERPRDCRVLARQPGNGPGVSRRKTAFCGRAAELGDGVGGQKKFGTDRPWSSGRFSLPRCEFREHALSVLGG